MHAVIKAMTDTEIHFLNQLNEMIQDFSLSDAQLQQLRLYYNNLVEWNQKMNLTSITDEQDVYEKHFLDSYSLLINVPRETLTPGKALLDVGTGAGFPGIPIAIGFPEINVTLMDSLNKRIIFLLDTVNKLQIRNVRCVHGRAEELGKDNNYREQFDVVVSRAVANLNVLNEYCLPFVKTGGLFIAYKSDKVREELEAGNKAAGILGADLIKEFSFYLPETDYRRTLLAYKKTKSTPSRYPRNAGIPSKKPLGLPKSI